MPKINKNVIFLGIVSLLTDISSEMIFPVLPIFLEHFLKATKLEIGIIEGTAEFTASFLKVISGVVSDRIHKRKPLIILGYSLSAFSKPLLYFASNWKFVLGVKVLDRTGKGIRTSPRDALISYYTTRETSGSAFGIHRGMDTLGAVIGSVITFLFLLFSGIKEETFRSIFLFSIIPGASAIFILIFFVKEPDIKPSRIKKFSLKLPQNFYLFFIFQFVFTLLTMNYAFMILKANDIGISIGFIPAVYLVFNIVYALSSYPVGKISDKLGKISALSFIYTVFSLTALLFTFDREIFGWIGFALYGVFMAGYEVVSRAVISDIVPEKLKGTAYGIYHTGIGIASFLSLSIAGFLWDRFGADIPFYISAFLSLILAFLIFLFFKKRI